jgi:hypothetical protein
MPLGDSAWDVVRCDQAAVRAGSSNRPVRQTRAKSRTAAPAKTPRAPTETEAASASDAPTPAATSAAVPAPAWVAAPAGPTGSAAAAAPAQRQKREWERGTEPERAEQDEARHSANQPAAEDERPGLRCVVQRRRAGAYPAAEPEAQSAFASGEAGQGDDHRGGCDSGDRCDRAHPNALSA